MSHSSQVTQAEYANKHESNITSRMANMWERKIGSDKDHKPSPTTVVKQPTVKMETMKPLTKTSSRNVSSNLQRKNTREIVEAYEKMASNNGQAKHLSEPDKLGKRGSRKTSIESATVVKQPSMAKMASRNANTNLRRKNTREIVESFERMASNNSSASELDKVGKKSSMNANKMSFEAKEDISRMIERICKQMRDLSDDIVVLKSKIDGL